MPKFVETTPAACHQAGRDAAWRAAQQTIPLFKDGLEARFLFLPQGEDPDSLIRARSKDIFLQYIEEGESLASFIFSKLSENIDIRTPAGKARFVQTAKPILDKFPNGVYKKLIFEELEKKVGIPINYAVTATSQNKAKISRQVLNKATPVRLAVSALLRQPFLASDINIDLHLHESSIPGVALLIKIISICKQESDLNAAALIERFRGQQEEQQLQKLMAWNSPELEDPKRALDDALAWIQRKSQSGRVKELIDKESTDGLTDDERQEIRNLLHQKAS